MSTPAQESLAMAAKTTTILLAHTHSPADIDLHRKELYKLEQLLRERSSQALDLYLACTSSEDSIHLNHIQDAFYQQEQKLGIWINAAETLKKIGTIARKVPEVWGLISGFL
ncbi:MAG: hypothetical protein Q9186_001914 [Xanthomendoza sp. 1 TL-2023]